MSIELKCPSCAKAISAPDDAGGKRGKCPHCGVTFYIPTPPDPDEGEIAISPIDTERERVERELLEESVAFSRDREALPAEESPGKVLDIAREVNRYLSATRDSKFEDAEAAVGRLRTQKVRAHDHVQSMLMDEMLEPLKGVPIPVMKGLLQKLLKELA